MAERYGKTMSPTVEHEVHTWDTFAWVLPMRPYKQLAVFRGETVPRTYPTRKAAREARRELSKKGLTFFLAPIRVTVSFRKH